MDPLMDFFDFDARPGHLFVVATLLPLLAFLVCLLIGAKRAYFSRYRDSEGTGDNIYRMLGGDTPPPYAAWIGTAAIGLAFVFSAWGFVLHQTEHVELEAKLATLGHGKDKHGHDGHKHDHKDHKDSHGDKKDDHKEDPEKAAAKRKQEKDAAKAAAKLEKDFHKRWTGHITWAKLIDRSFQESNQPRFLNPDHATSLTLGYNIDHLATLMFVMVTFISTLIFLFSIGYMSDERQKTVEDHEVHTADGHLKRRGRFNRFFLFLSLFCFSMLNLVLADNLFQVFVSWELVGICSYLLIGFYYERQSASNAANKAFITNRVGDAGFIIGLLILWTYCGTLNFDGIFNQVRAPEQDSHRHAMPVAQEIVRVNPKPVDVNGTDRFRRDANGSHVILWGDHTHAPVKHAGEYHFEADNHGEPVKTMPTWLLVLAGLGIFLGCVGKSAQFPLQVWLPDAMEGPTPVSALIHAATMVAAGVYLVGRCFPLFTAEVLLVIAYTGAITLFVAATIAVVMTDIKKVLAYSTVSQLGYMMLALGIGGWVAGLFHLFTHAFFKALLFLGSGSVIYGCHHVQEMGKMGGLYPKMKITALTMLMGVLAIAGTPFFSGWYSKDAIIAQAMGFTTVHREHALLFILPLLTAGITTFYMFRMWFLTFAGEPRDKHVHEHAHESPWLMTVPLILLAICAVAVAWGWPIWDAEASAMEGHIHHAQYRSIDADFGYANRPKMQSVAHHTHDLHRTAGGLALIVVLIGFGFAVAIYYYRALDPADAKEQAPGIHRFLSHKWYFDELYSALLVRPMLHLGQWCKKFDLGIIDGFLHFLARTLVWLSWLGGLFDRYVIDGLANLIGSVTTSSGNWLKNVQTGYLRSYVLFLVLAAVGLWVLLSALLLPSVAAK